MTLSNYSEDNLLNWWLRNSTVGFTPPTAWWLSLHTADPGETGTASPLASCPRFQVTFSAAASATADNDATASVVSSATGTITFAGLWDGSATLTANHLWSGAVSPTFTVANVGDTVTLASDALSISLS